MKKVLLVITTLGLSTFHALAGGILTNTNQNIAFNRNFARDGVIGIDGVYSNPAGVAFLSDGFRLSLNFQNVYQTRTIESGMTIPGLKGTPFEHPFRLYGGNEQGVKKYEGKASVPVLPSFQAALNRGRWAFQLGFGLVGGGGKASFNEGLGSFERRIAALPAIFNLLPGNKPGLNAAIPKDQQAALGVGSTTPAYSVKSYIHGQQYVFGLQFGSSYKINDNFAVYGGLRFNYVYNKYEGSITDISVNINGNNENLNKYLSDRKAGYEALKNGYAQQAQQAAAAAAQYQQAGDAQKAAQYATLAQQAQSGAVAAGTLAAMPAAVADKYLDCTQTGWGVTPIIGVHFHSGKLDVGTRVEFTSRLNIQNDTRRDDTGMFQNGVNTPNDLPGLWTIGASYEVLPSLRVMGGYHYYFDKDADMAEGKQKYLSGNTQEFLAGVEYDITKDFTVSAGGQKTNYALGDGKFLSDMSFVVSSYSLGLGAKFRITKKMQVNVAYFFTKYDHFNKTYETNVGTEQTPLMVTATDRFTRTNKAFGAGLDITF